MVLPAQAGRLLLNVYRHDGLHGILKLTVVWQGLAAVAEAEEKAENYLLLWFGFVRWVLGSLEEGRFREDWVEVFYPFVDGLWKSALQVDPLLGLDRPPERRQDDRLPAMTGRNRAERALAEVFACADIHAAACAIVAEGLEEECQKAETAADDSPTAKKSTVKGEAQEKIIAALTLHHKYQDGSCLNLEPIGNNELARLAKVDQATASAFFKQKFGGHVKYRATCGDAGRLVAALKLLRGEYSPLLLYGGKPPGEGEHDDDEE